MNDRARWLTPGENGLSRKQVLEARHLIKRAVRDYLHGEGFIEIDAPLLVRGTTPDAMIDSFESGDRALVTSTEYQLKRLEAGGFARLYTLTQNFRLADHGPWRNPEFTMLEWARAGGTLAEIEGDAEAMCLAAWAALGGGEVLHYQGHDIVLRRPWRRLSVSDAIATALGHPLHGFDLPSLLYTADESGLAVRSEMRGDRDFVFALIMEQVQARLGFEAPVFLTAWPAFQSASTGGNAMGIAERSELVIAGVELSDGFPSLTGEERQRQSFAEQQASRVAQGKHEVVLDERYLAMLREGLPEGAGMALGFDRMVMLLTNQKTLRPTLAFAWDEV